LGGQLYADVRFRPGETDPQDTLWVPDDYATIQAGIDACPRGGTVMVRPGTYPENVSFHGSPLSLIGLEGADSTLIDAPDSTQAAIWFDADDEFVSRIEGFTLTGGRWGIQCHAQQQQAYRLWITNNVVQGNSGGLELNQTSARIRNTTVWHNLDSGGVVMQNADSVEIRNCIIAWNRSETIGGGIFMDNSVGNLINSTVYHNTTEEFGGAIACIVAGSLRVENSILWANQASQGFNEIYGTAIPWISVTYTDIAEGWTDTGNVDLDPQFVDTLEVSPDFHLSEGSPCVDAGNPAPEFNDPDGSRNDMGAYGGPGAEGWTGIPQSRRAEMPPRGFRIVALYPNPANPSATLIYEVERSGHIEVTIYNVLGQRIAALADEVRLPGRYSLTLNGSELVSGLYFCQFDFQGTDGIKRHDTSKLLILR